MAMNAEGTTITFGTSGFTAEMTAINIVGMSRGARDVTHLGTTNAREFQPDELPDYGDINISFRYDPDDSPPIDQAKEQITITYPTPSGGLSGATDVGDGFMTEFEITAELDGVIEGSGTVKRSGQWTRTAST